MQYPSDNNERTGNENVHPVLDKEIGVKKYPGFQYVNIHMFPDKPYLKDEKKPINPVMTDKATRIIFIVLSMRMDYNCSIK